jgi:hypothetical protein
MNPEIQPGVYVFRTLAEERGIPAAIKPLLIFREQREPPA